MDCLGPLAQAADQEILQLTARPKLSLSVISTDSELDEPTGTPTNVRTSCFVCLLTNTFSAYMHRMPARSEKEATHCSRHRSRRLHVCA